MSDSNSKPEVTKGEGVLIPPETKRKPRGQQAAHIRYLADRFPGMRKVDIARKVGCGQDHVAHVISRYVKAVSPEELQDFQGNKADIYDAMQHRTLSSITDESLAKCSALQLVIAAATLEDKARLVRGQPTALHVHALIDVLQAIKERGDE